MQGALAQNGMIVRILRNDCNEANSTHEILMIRLQTYARHTVGGKMFATLILGRLARRPYIRHHNIIYVAMSVFFADTGSYRSSTKKAYKKGHCYC